MQTHYHAHDAYPCQCPRPGGAYWWTDCACYQAEHDECTEPEHCPCPLGQANPPGWNVIDTRTT